MPFSITMPEINIASFIRRRTYKAKAVPQIVALCKLFKSNIGRDPSDLAELEYWFATPEGQTALTPHLNKDGKIIADKRRYNGDASRFAGKKPVN
jgi:hypothetical protein